MADFMDKLTNTEAMAFIDKVQEPFKSLPHLPKGIVEFFVQIAPYLALLGAILGVVGALLGGAIGSLASLLTLSPVFFITTVVNIVIVLAGAAILFMAFNPLKNREMKGWVLLFWSEMLNIVSALLSVLTVGAGGLVGAVIGGAIGLYILFEMKPFYGAKAKK